MVTADRIVDVLVWVIVVPAVLYPLLYSFRPWTATPVGRAMMLKGSGNALLVAMIWARQVFGDYPGRPIVLVVGFSLFSAGIWYLLLALLRSNQAREYPPFRWRRHSATRRHARKR